MTATDPRLERPAEVEAFYTEVSDFLLIREAENCVMIGLCSQLRAGAATLRTTKPYFAVIRSGDAVTGAALIDGFLVVLSSPIQSTALSLLAADIARAVPNVPGVVGETEASRGFAQTWTTVTGQAHRLNMSERIFRCGRVSTQQLPSGTMRLAADQDRALIARWLGAFSHEALAQSVDDTAMDQFAARWIARQGRAMYVWIEGSRPVSMVGVSGETPNGIRVAPVYTPPELRGRGYASALTAQVTQAQLLAGKRCCFLFTDLANPTSNHIYQAIGYKSVADAADYRFGGGVS